jgi:hypothetical protein
MDLMLILRCLPMAARIPHPRKDRKWLSIVMVSSLCIALYLWPFHSLEWRRLKLFANYFVRVLIMVVILSSLSLTRLSTSLFLGLYGKVTNSSLFVSLDIFLVSLFPYNIELDCCWLSLLLMHFLYEILPIKRIIFNLSFKKDCVCWNFTHKHCS